VSCKLRVIADDDGYFKLPGITRNEFEIVFDDVKKKVTNEKYDELNIKREEEIVKRKAEFDVKMTEYEAKLKEYDTKIKEYEDLVKAKAPKPDNSPDPKPEDKKPEMEKKPEKPERPLAPINPPDVPKEVEISEKVPRIANMASEVTVTAQSGFYNVQEKAR